MKQDNSPGFPLRIHWRPSRWQLAALIVLSTLTQAALMLSGLPSTLHRLLAALALLWSLALIWRHLRAPALQLDWPHPQAGALLQGAGQEQSVQVLAIRFRGPMAQVRLRTGPGRTRSLIWWPDTLSVAKRRNLGLAQSAQQRNALLPLVAG